MQYSRSNYHRMAGKSWNFYMLIRVELMKRIILFWPVYTLNWFINKVKIANYDN